MKAASQLRTRSNTRFSFVCAVCSAFAIFLGAAWTVQAQVAGPPSGSSSANYLTPVAAKISPDGTKLYVVCEDDDSLLALDLRTQQVVKKTKVGHKPKDLALSPEGKTLYVSNEWSDTVTVVDAESFNVRQTLTTGWGPRGLATDRSGKILYVANSIGNDVSVLD